MKENSETQQNTEKELDNKKEKTTKKSNKKEKIQKQNAELQQALTEMNDKYLRIVAEYDNYRKRTLKEKMELSKNAGEKIFMNLLPIIDNMERAQAAINDAKDIDALKEGIKLISSGFKNFLSQNGVTEIEVINEPFDTDVSEAITKIPAPNEEMKGKVIDCTEKGYKLNDKVIRYAKVVVGE